MGRKGRGWKPGEMFRVMFFRKKGDAKREDGRKDGNGTEVEKMKEE